MTQARDQVRKPLLEAFERNFREREELGASVSVFMGEEEVLNLSHGFADRERSRPWTAETLVPVWSATKGPAAVACLCALDDAKLPLEAPVCEVHQPATIVPLGPRTNGNTCVTR